MTNTPFAAFSQHYTFSPSVRPPPLTAITVAAVNDAQVEGNHSSKLTFDITSQDVGYDPGWPGFPVSVPALWVPVTDNDGGTQQEVGRWEFDTANVNLSARTVNDSVGDFDAVLDYDSDLGETVLFEKAGTDYHYMTAPGDADPNYTLMVFDTSGDWHYLPERDLTLEAWVACDSTSDDHRGIIGCQEHTGNLQYGWSLACRAGRFKTGLRTENNNDMGYLISSTNIVPGQWRHVAATYDGSNFKLYVDGQLDVEAERTGDISYFDVPFTLSEYIDQNQDVNFDGRLQEVRLYNYALDAATIMEHYVTMPPGSLTTITENGGTIVNEEGPTSDSYTVVLDTAPAADVLITITPPADLDVGSGAGAARTLTFTAANWATPQTVTVTTIDDEELEGDETVTITHSISSAGDAVYNASAVRNVYVDILDNECGAWGYMIMDLNNDCRVDLYDYSIFASYWEDCSMPYEAGCVDTR